MNGVFVVRAMKAFVIFLIIALVLLGLAYYVTGSFDSASQEVRRQYDGVLDPVRSVTRVLEGARFQLMQWILASSLAAWLCASLFLIQAEQFDARNVQEGASKLVSWLILFVLTIGLTAGIWYGSVSVEDVASMILADNYLMVLVTTFILLPLGYWLATGLAVKGVMRPSVPVSGLLPRFWS